MCLKIIFDRWIEAHQWLIIKQIKCWYFQDCECELCDDPVYPCILSPKNATRQDLYFENLITVSRNSVSSIRYSSCATFGANRWSKNSSKMSCIYSWIRRRKRRFVLYGNRRSALTSAPSTSRNLGWGPFLSNPQNQLRKTPTDTCMYFFQKSKASTVTLIDKAHEAKQYAYSGNPLVQNRGQQTRAAKAGEFDPTAPSTSKASAKAPACSSPVKTKR